jgi:hypothetical protein
MKHSARNLARSLDERVRPRSRNTENVSGLFRRYKRAIDLDRVCHCIQYKPRSKSLRFAQRICGAIYHLARDAWILDFSVSVGEAPSLLFLLFGSKNNLLRGLK